MIKVITLAIMGALICTPANASQYKPDPTHTIKIKTSQHIYCPYKGCKGKFH